MHLNCTAIVSRREPSPAFDWGDLERLSSRKAIYKSNKLSNRIGSDCSLLVFLQQSALPSAAHRKDRFVLFSFVRSFVSKRQILKSINVHKQ